LTRTNHPGYTMNLHIMILSNYHANDIGTYGSTTDSEYPYYDPAIAEYEAHTLLMNNAGVMLGDVMAPSGTVYQLAPQYVHYIQSSPISAMAIYLKTHAVCVAGHHITLNRKRTHAMYPTPMISSSDRAFMERRVSMLATHSFPD